MRGGTSPLRPTPSGCVPGERYFLLHRYAELPLYTDHLIILRMMTSRRLRMGWACF
jgi:hypothetical protein